MAKTDNSACSAETNRYSQSTGTQRVTETAWKGQSLETKGTQRKSILISFFLFHGQDVAEDIAIAVSGGDSDGFQVLIRVRARSLSRKARSHGRHHGRFVLVQPLFQITLIRLMDAVHRRWWPCGAFVGFLLGPPVRSPFSLACPPELWSKTYSSWSRKYVIDIMKKLIARFREECKFDYIC